MDAVVSIRSNATGMLSPPSAKRQAVSASLAEQAAVRSGARLAARLTEALQEDATTSSTSGTSGAGSTGSSALRAPQSELGKESFLQLLVLQLQNQDPLSPQDNTEMIAQLAQFSALEAMTNLTDSFDLLSGNVDQLNFISAGQLLGRTVEGLDLDGQFRSGVVEGVHLDGSLVVLTVDGGLMSMAGITSIAQPTETESQTLHSELQEETLPASEEDAS